MPRHAFSFPEPVRAAVREHVRRAVERVDPARYRQESPYVAALANALVGIANDGPDGRVVLQSTVVNDKGRGAAERWSGADLAITAEVSDGRLSIRKAILVQAKLGRIDELWERETTELQNQIQHMRRLTPSPKILEIRDEHGARVPVVLSGKIVAEGGTPKPYGLANYFVQRILTTLDGDTRPNFVGAVQESRLTTLKVIATRGH